MDSVLIRNVVLIISITSLIMVIADSDFARPAQSPGSKWSVHIVNQMKTGGVLFLHCKSKDNDLGIQNVPYGQEFSWHFRENLWVTTLYWCYFRSSHGHATFNVYWPEKRSSWLEVRCDYIQCIWNAKDDGIYLRNVPLGSDDYKHDWNSTTLQDDDVFLSE